MSTNKRYERYLKDKYDKPGKEYTNEIMLDISRASFVRENIKEDSGDFSEGFWDQEYLMPNGKIRIVESEMKDGKWFGMYWSPKQPFEFDDVDICYRKVKYIAHTHLVISTIKNYEDFVQYAFIVTRKAMDEALAAMGGCPIIKPTIYKPEGEPFFRTPVSKGRFVYKGLDGHWHFWHPTK